MLTATQKLFQVGTTGLFLSTYAMATSAAAGSEANNNFLEIIDPGHLNQLSIIQVEPNKDHSAKITISDLPYVSTRAEYQPEPVWFSEARTGSVVQSGFRQTATIEVFGRGNLFSITQSGASNVARGFIAGTGNQATISQAGTNNYAVFSQTGQNNFIAINQRM